MSSAHLPHQNHRGSHLRSGRTCHPHSRHKGQICQLGLTCYLSLQILRSLHHSHHRDCQSDPCPFLQRVHQSPFPCLHKVHQRQGCLGVDCWLEQSPCANKAS